MNNFSKYVQAHCILTGHLKIKVKQFSIAPPISTDVIGKGLKLKSNSVDNKRLIEVNENIRNHPVEWIGQELRGYMTDMKRIVEAN